MNRLLDTLRSMKDKKNIFSSDSFRRDLKPWSMFMDTYNDVSFIPSSIWFQQDVSFATGSCLIGCGGICRDEYFHNGFLVINQILPTHCKVMMAVLIAVDIWGSRLHGMKVHIHCDNEPAVKVIYSYCTKDTFLASCIHEL